MDNKKNARKAITSRMRFLGIFAVLFVVLAIAMAGTASAKSLYVISDMREVNISAWDLQGSPNYMVWQYTNTVPDYGWGAVGLAIDGNAGILFVTYENSNTIQLLNAYNMADEDTTTAPGAGDLAGIVYDDGKGKVYAVDRRTNDLYVYDWNADTKTLTAAPNSPFQLEYSGAYGIALDETNDYLYVTSNSATIYYYNTGDFSGTETITAAGSYIMPHSATSVAVDPDRNYLYSGDGFGGSDYLDQYNLTDGTNAFVDVYDSGSGQGVIGLDVDLDTGYIYITTGAQSGSYHHLKAYNTSLSPLDDETQDIGIPTDIAIPAGEVSYSPLHLIKDDGVSGCVNPEDTITYTLDYSNDNAYTVHNVTINDSLPYNVTFDSASDGGTYDSGTHNVTWNLGDLLSSASGSVTLNVTVNSGTWGTTLHNTATIDSNETNPSSNSVDTSVCALPPTGESTDSDGWTKNEYTTEEDVYATGSGFNPIFANMNIYVFDDYAWTDGDNIAGYTIYASLMSVPVTGGNVGPVIIWEKKDTKIGEYDIFFDANKNGIYDAGIDAIDDPNHPGFTISGQEVPALTPFGLLALVGLLSVIAVLTIRKKRE
ncbi:hypothetical protein C5S30_06085 [ANME-1 cluster archaeon GoMg4]|nr:hypothetical protein [ANME-1 cluster archaeon GoMg4]